MKKELILRKGLSGGRRVSYHSLAFFISLVAIASWFLPNSYEAGVGRAFLYLVCSVLWVLSVFEIQSLSIRVLRVNASIYCLFSLYLSLLNAARFIH